MSGGVRLARLDAHLARLSGPPAHSDKHLVIIDRFGRGFLLHQAMCSCGWTGTDKTDSLTAEHERAEHEKEMRS